MLQGNQQLEFPDGHGALSSHNFGYVLDDGTMICGRCCSADPSTPCIDWVSPVVGILRGDKGYTLVHNKDGYYLPETAFHPTLSAAMVAAYPFTKR